MKDIQQLEHDLWEAADQLRANSKLTASEYSMPVLGLIFLRHAFNRFRKVKEKIEAGLPEVPGRGKRPVRKEDYEREAAIFLPEDARFDHLVNFPESVDLGAKINEAMRSIEAEYSNLEGVLPKNYNIFESGLLRELLRIFNREALEKANGDVFGKIYEYFLNKFAMTGAQEGGEFFTPISLVGTIVNVIEPDHGTILDPACGSGGMFVQTGYFIQEEGQVASEKVTFYGQERADTNTNLARMNLAVHGLEGRIVQGNTFYEDKHELLGRCDFVMANPPFNVDGVEPTKPGSDPRLPFGLPGVNQKTKALSNANYLWIQYFYSYLNETGRAGFVMASSASDAGHKEKDIREKLVRTGDVDVMIAIGTNFFYTRTLPCTLWFFDKGKKEELKHKTLMIDARNIYRKVTRKIYDFTPEQLSNITAIVWLYRGETEKYLALVQKYLETAREKVVEIPEVISPFEADVKTLLDKFAAFYERKRKEPVMDEEHLNLLREQIEQLKEDYRLYEQDRKALTDAILEYSRWFSENQPDGGMEAAETNKWQRKAYERFLVVEDRVKGIQKQVDHLYKTSTHLTDYVQKEMEATKDPDWDNRTVNTLLKEADQHRKEAIEQLKEPVYFQHQVKWLKDRFLNVVYTDVPGLCKLVSEGEIEQNDWSLTPGRYVGVSLQKEEDFDFEERLQEVHTELQGLNEEAEILAATIQKNFNEL